MSDTATVDAIRSALDGLIAGCEKLDARIDAMTKNDADRKFEPVGDTLARYLELHWNSTRSQFLRWARGRSISEAEANFAFNRFNRLSAGSREEDPTKSKQDSARADAGKDAGTFVEQKHPRNTEGEFSSGGGSGRSSGGSKSTSSSAPKPLHHFNGMKSWAEQVKRDYPDVKVQQNGKEFSAVLKGVEVGKFSRARGAGWTQALAGSSARHDYITESGGKFTVHAESGKPMGAYGSKGEAEKRLREIEYFKRKK